MMWLVVGVALVAGMLWAWEHRSGRDHVPRLPQPPDPFEDRRSMMRYHAALRPKRH